MKIIALIGSSGCGKTALSLRLAQNFNGAILSLDSLSIYKEIDIASAKPTKAEMGDIMHFGIDILSPLEPQNVQNFIKEFFRAKEYCERFNKNLFIVGGSGFYLKTLLCGISNLPEYNKDEMNLKLQELATIQEKYAFLENIDNAYAKSLKPSDSYRITRALEIYFSTKEIPSLYFKNNPPTPILRNCAIFEILLLREVLRERINLRTQKMLENGLILEAKHLQEKYTRAHQWAKSIGIKEVFAFLDGEIKSENELCNLISIHTAQLAKRQRTFNKTQFAEHFCGEANEIEREIGKILGSVL